MNLRTTSSSRLLRRSALAVALGLSLSGGAALAQTSATGVIFGRAAAVPGTTVQVENLDTGLTRTLAVDAQGRYRATALPVGRYKVTLIRNGESVASRDNVQVTIGSGSDVSFAAAGTQALEGVSVVASALPAIDVSSVSSQTVLTAQDLAKLPVGRSVNAAALLAPGTVSGDSRYGNVVSFGGASASENQYYINGFPVTNPLRGVGFSSLPFDAIDQEQVKTGGYGAEYGRSLGGVVNIVTKSGTNNWKFGAQVLWSPRALASTPKNAYYPNNGSQFDGTLLRDRSQAKTWQTDYAAYVSGPLIKDKLFMYLTAEQVKTGGAELLGNNTGGTTQATYPSLKTNRWMAKFNWNITDNHTLEFTGIKDKVDEVDDIYSYDYSTGARGALLGQEIQKNNGVAGSTPGGSIYIGKYTGYITDDLTITALYGKTHSSIKDQLLGAGGVECPLVIDVRGVSPGYNSCWLNTTAKAPGAKNDTNGWRFDVEYHIGDHTLRAGLDNLTLKAYDGTVYAGGEYWRYANTTDVDLTAYPNVTLDPNNLPAYIVRQRIINFSANVKVEQEAQYIEDHWQINDRWLAYIGLRNEQFSNFNGAGEVYVRQRHQLDPRLGISWDVFGDSSLKVYANAGRYHLAIPSSVAIRGASASLFSNQWFTYTSVDPVTGVPSGLSPVTGILYSNGADGTTTPDPRTVAAKNIKAYYQDEYILGFDKQLGANWTFGAKATYRELKSIIDDFCDYTPFVNYAARNNIDISNANISGCYLFNPGQSNTFTVDVTGNGDYQDFKITPQDFVTTNGVGFPKLKRKYLAVNVYLAHQFADDWYGKIEYVWSKNYGNSEGQLKSDIGQVDVGQTQDWDFPELMIGSSGYLPNDRRHQIKAYGYWQPTPEWLVGANLVLASGRPKNCLGTPPSGYDRQGYGPSFFFCDFGNGPQLNTRGTLGRLPWTYNVNLSARYRPAWADHNLSFEADVFNLFNRQNVTSIQETNGGSPTYSAPLSFNRPRYVRVGVRYDFSL